MIIIENTNTKDRTCIKGIGNLFNPNNMEINEPVNNANPNFNVQSFLIY